MTALSSCTPVPTSLPSAIRVRAHGSDRPAPRADGAFRVRASLAGSVGAAEGLLRPAGGPVCTPAGRRPQPAAARGASESLRLPVSGRPRRRSASGLARAPAPATDPVRFATQAGWCYSAHRGYCTGSARLPVTADYAGSTRLPVTVVTVTSEAPWALRRPPRPCGRHCQPEWPGQSCVGPPL